MKNKELTPRQKTVNRLYSELYEDVWEVEYTETEYGTRKVLSLFSRTLQAAGVDSTIIVEVLEQFGKTGKEEALVIKINEGR